MLDPSHLGLLGFLYCCLLFVDVDLLCCSLWFWRLLCAVAVVCSWCLLFGFCYLLLLFHMHKPEVLRTSSTICTQLISFSVFSRKLNLNSCSLHWLFSKDSGQVNI